MTNKANKTLYAYVDESGQQTAGKFFVVGVVLTGDPREVIGPLEAIEESSKKSNLKWRKTDWRHRRVYIEQVGKLNLLKGSIFRQIYREGKNYRELTADAVAVAARTKRGYSKLTVRVDALRRNEINTFKRYLKPSVKVKLVVLGVRRDESNALIRLADAVCGLGSDADGGHEWSIKALSLLKKRGVMI